MAPPAVAMTDGILEDTVDFRPNYDSRETEPSVLPAAIPHLIVNGTTGIAVGMATNIAPHNLIEVVQALRHLIKHPDASVDDADALHPRARPADRRQDRRPRRRQGGLRDRPRHVPDARHRPRRDPRPAQGHRGHRAALRRRHREGRRAHQDAGADQEAAGHLRHQGPHRPREGPAPGHRGQERLPPRGAARAALQADADGGLLRHQHRRPRRRPAAHPRAARAAPGLPRPPLRGRPAPLGLPARQGRRPPPPRPGPAGRDPRHRRGHPADPHQRQHRGGQGAADPGLRPHRRSRPTTSSRCRCAG